MKRFRLRLFLVITGILVVMGTNVFADNIDKLKDKKNQADEKANSLQNELADVLAQISDIEQKIADKATEIEKTAIQLEEMKEIQKQQYQDMKLRIQYMYEDQNTSIMELLLTAKSMGEVLSKAEYLQKVYDYDREKLDQMAQTATAIEEHQQKLIADAVELENLQADLTAKKEILYTEIAKYQNESKERAKEIEEAIKQAAAAQAAKEASKLPPYVPKGDSAVADGVVSLAYTYLGTPYRSGGSSPSGFDCSGFTSFLYRHYGIELSRTTGGQAGGGNRIGGLSEALPGDIICYPGHVGLYIGNGQIIHAPVPGDVVKVASVHIMGITAIRRYW